MVERVEVPKALLDKVQNEAAFGRVALPALMKFYNEQTGPKVANLADTSAAGVAQIILNNPALLETVFNFLMKFLADYLGKDHPAAQPVPPPVRVDPTPVPVPQPVPGPAPSGRVVKSVKVGLGRIQYSRDRFPEEYANGKDGFFHDLAGAQSGRSAIPFDSNVWVDITPVDQFGVPFERTDPEAEAWAYHYRHDFGPAHIEGHGGTPGNPVAGYEVVEDDAIGVSTAAWVSRESLGALCRFKMHKEGSYAVKGTHLPSGLSDGFTVRVS